MTTYSRSSLVGLTLALCLAGCGKSETPASTEQPSDAPAAQSTAAAPAPAAAAPAPAPAAAPAPAVAAGEQVLNIYNWSDYIAADTIANFEKETGIKVRYDVFDSNEVLEAKLLAGNTGYDIVVPSASFVARQIKAGIFQPLDKSKLPNYANLDPELMKILAGYDAGNQHIVPWLWGTTGIGYNVKKIKERMPDAPIGSWDLILKPEILAKFKDCGVTMLDTPAETIPTSLRYLGLPTGSQDAANLAKAEALMMSVRPSVKYFHSSQYINDLANGEICLVMGWSGDVFIARDRAAEAKNGNEIAYFIPREGALMWFDTMGIPKDAKHAENAYKFLDYVMRPKVMAAVTNQVKYANGNAASTEYVEEAVREDPAIYPNAATKKNLFPNVVNTSDYERLVTRAWTRIKTNQ
ncbi:MAG: polyamine ABC transporter substrate-binding protein [Gammaproteobacteria bacterium]|nr:polyamine ABC transporter substrate-binding protein [Gammaproteobacteria bacterium]